MIAVPPKPQFGVNPMPPPHYRLQAIGSWWDRNKVKVLKTSLVVGGIAIVGAVTYVVISALLGGQQSPACTALQNQLYALQKQEMAIYRQAADQGGTFTAAQQAEIQSINSSIASVVGQLSQTCVASPGTTLEKTIDQIIIYGLWAAAIAAGIIVAGVTIYAIRWLIKRWGGPKDGSQRPPSSPSDVEPSTEFDDSTAGTDAAMGRVANNFESGQIDASQASETAANLSASDPAIGVSSAISDFFANLADTVTETIAVVLDALSAVWAAIVDALDAVYTEIAIFLGI